jgi:signal transduction histidine kinase
MYSIQENQAVNAVRSVQNLFREEMLSSNFLYLSRSVSDLELNRTIRCSVITNLDQQTPIPILDLRAKGNCSKFQSEFLLDGAFVNTKLKALNGSQYSVQFRVVNSGIFQLAAWVLRIAGLLGIVLSYLLFQSQKARSRILIESEKRIAENKMEIARQVAHDIRSPISSINLVLSVIKTDKPEELQVLKTAAHQVNQIANDLLSRSQEEFQIHADLQSAATQSVYKINIAELTREILNQKKMLLESEKKQIKIESEIKCSKEIIIRMSPATFQRIISNILNNAIEAVNPEAGQINLTLGEDKTHINLEIQDNGKGIPTHIISKVGKKGFSFKKNKLKSSGSGLGVFHAIKSINEANGQMEIESTEGQGTNIKIHLPTL